MAGSKSWFSEISNDALLDLKTLWIESRFHDIQDDYSHQRTGHVPVQGHHPVQDMAK
jgi:hypothetical protein